MHAHVGARETAAGKAGSWVTLSRAPQMARRHSRPPPVHSSIAGARTYSWLRVCTIIPHFMAGWRCRQAQVLSCLPSSRLGDISVVSLALAAHSFVRRCVPVSGVVCVPCGCCCVRPSASVFPCQRAWCQQTRQKWTSRVGFFIFARRAPCCPRAPSTRRLASQR